MRPDIAGSDTGHDRPFGDVLDVVGDPVDEEVAVAAELVGCHGDDGTGNRADRRDQPVGGSSLPVGRFLRTPITILVKTMIRPAAMSPNTST